MRFVYVFLALLLVGMLGCADDSLVNILVDEEETLGVEMTLEDQRVLPADNHLLPGQVAPIMSMPADESPEGIILDQHGNIYVGVRRTTEASRESKILKIAPDGGVSVFAVLPSAAPEATGVLGLGIDPSGNVYAAHVTQDPATHGVWRIRRNGGARERLAGSQAIIFPNALTFDARGNLYVTDSFGGAIWRYGKDRQFSLWIQHALLESVELPGAPFPIPGANGIAFFPPNKLYVANTSQFSVVRIVVAPDGSASEAELVAQGLGLFSIDGLAVDVHENVYGVLAASNAEETGTPVNPVPPLVKVDPHTGDVSVVLEDDAAFDAPTSLAFGRGRRDHKSVFIANSALFGPVTNGPGPGVVQVGVDVAGFPRQVVRLGTDDNMTPFVGEFTYAADPAMGVVPCHDPSGNAAPGLALPIKANVDGRASYLEKTTGYFTTNECQARADGSLASAGDWVFIGADGHRVMGTWTATTRSDGSLTGTTVVTGGIGSFTDATGWTRFTGQIDLTTGRGTFYGKGQISRPKPVKAMGYVSETTYASTSGSIRCRDRSGNATWSGTQRIEGTGLATYLGVYRFVGVNERCIDDGEVSTFYGTWVVTNARGDVLRGTSAVKIGVGEPWPNELLITGGEGRFEGATGWMNGLVYWGEKYDTAEGMVFMPR